MDSFLKENTRR